MKPTPESVTYHRFNWQGFLVVFVSALAIGAIAHEMVHLLTIENPVSVSIYFGRSDAILGTCCLLPGEEPFELLAYFIQLVIMIAWFFLNMEFWLNQTKETAHPFIPRDEKEFATRFKNTKTTQKSPLRKSF